MAQAKFITDDAFELMIERAEAHGFSTVAEKALKAGAAVIADRMRSNLEKIISTKATGQLIGSFGISPVKEDKDRNYNVHLGFDGYREPGHVPFVLIARSFESGAAMGGRYDGTTTKGKRNVRKKLSRDDYWRLPTPFAKPAVAATKTQALSEMKRAAEKEMEKLIENL